MIVMIVCVRENRNRVSSNRYVAPQSWVNSVLGDRQGKIKLVALVISHKHICLPRIIMKRKIMCPEQLNTSLENLSDMTNMH